MKTQRFTGRLVNTLGRYFDVFVGLYFIADSFIHGMRWKLVFSGIFSAILSFSLYSFRSTFALTVFVLFTLSVSDFKIFQKMFVFLLSRRFYHFSKCKRYSRLSNIFCLLAFIFTLFFDEEKPKFSSIFALLSSFATSLIFSFLSPPKLQDTKVRVATLFSTAALCIFLNCNYGKVSFLCCFLLTIPSLRIEIPQLHFTKDSKRLLAFFTINFIFMFAEFIVGFSTNSLGLISDAFHMMCDNISLFCSVVASLLSSGKPTESFPFGMAFIETVCSLGNTCLLFFISFNLFSESISRMLEPPKVGEDGLILVSVLGLIVNLAGLFFTIPADGSTFTKTIFIHVFVDTMGSVAVIVSSIFVVNFGWYFVDPLCSFGIAISLFLTTIPLMGTVISQMSLESGQNKPKKEEIEEIVKVDEYKFWEGNSELRVASLKCELSNFDFKESTEKLSSFFKSNNCNDFTIEISQIQV